jgi:hypothetical protein
MAVRHTAGILYPKECKTLELGFFFVLSRKLLSIIANWSVFLTLSYCIPDKKKTEKGPDVPGPR